MCSEGGQAIRVGAAAIALRFLGKLLHYHFNRKHFPASFERWEISDTLDHVQPVRWPLLLREPGL